MQLKEMPQLDVPSSGGQLKVIVNSVDNKHGQRFARLFDKVYFTLPNSVGNSIIELLLKYVPGYNYFPISFCNMWDVMEWHRLNGTEETIAKQGFGPLLIPSYAWISQNGLLHFWRRLFKALPDNVAETMVAMSLYDVWLTAVNEKTKKAGGYNMIYWRDHIDVILPTMGYEPSIYNNWEKENAGLLAKLESEEREQYKKLFPQPEIPKPE